MRLGWQEIRKRAIEFSREFADATRENSESQTFYNEFFNVFGISRRRVASFEERVKKSGQANGRIDLFWPGQLLVEQKSAGQDLIKARAQAFDYFPGITEKELPRFVLISDFQNFELIDLDTGDEHQFTLKHFHKHIELFGFIVGYKKRVFKDQDKVNIAASEMMGRLHDQLKETGYEGPLLELFLVRLLFCLFADDTGIFDRDQFTYFIEERTREDGTDLGAALEHLFQILNTPHHQRASSLDEDLANFPYVNGDLFSLPLKITSFDSVMRKRLLEACYFDWSDISPAIFGSLFQSVMDKDKRRAIGAHYTTEQNIMKVIEPLFLDELRAEFEKIKTNKNKLREFHQKLAGLRFLDPACGCGNFLIIAYRELRLLEIEVLKVLHDVDRAEGFQRTMLDVGELSLVNVDHFYGIELEEFPARIAEVALWLVDHQMNMKLSQAFGVYYVRIPLTASPHIVHGNALEIEWSDVIAPSELDYILGNPPFIGSKYQSDEQRALMRVIFKDVKGAGVLDFVTAWFLRAGQFVQGTNIKCAFVSTNSISQGEQVGILWQELFQHYGIKIQFAHRTFAWGSEARGKANVHVVIIGFAAFDLQQKRLFEYEDIKGEPIEIQVKGINPYLVEGDSLALMTRKTPICDVPKMGIGNKPIDGGNYLFSEEERNEFLKIEPQAEVYFRPWIGSHEFINGYSRWCLWLGEASPQELRGMPEVMKRIEAVRAFRMDSKSLPTQSIANNPTRFHVENFPNCDYLVVPEVSSERRNYIPVGFCERKTISSNLLKVVSNATLMHFGVLSSSMHMGWVKFVAGRLKSDFRYSNTLVYNNFPWPETPSDTQKERIEQAAQKVLDVRDAYPESSLADLYDPLTMPPDLLKAHQALDKAVDRAYRPQPFPSERHRIEFLFSLYEKLTAPLESKEKK